MPDEPAQFVLRFERVTVEFDGYKALDQMSFEVAPGESVVVFGAAGSGKTVLLKTALGLQKPEAGRVFVFGRDITDLPEQKLFGIRREMGVLFQEGGLFDSLTIEENVSYPLANLAGFIALRKRCTRAPKKPCASSSSSTPWRSSQANSRAACGAAWESPARW